MSVSSDPAPLRIARFLRDYVQSRQSVTRNLDSYEQVLWFHDLPDTGVVSAAHATPGEGEDTQEGVWLEVRDEPVPPPPPAPDELEPWLERRDGDEVDRRPRKLLPKTTLPDPDGSGALVAVELEDHPRIRELYAQYDSDYAAWVQSSRALLERHELYTRLFRIHRELERDGETLELGIGFGLLDWPKPNVGLPIRRHAVFATADLQFVPTESTIRVVCPETGVKLGLEDDMIEAEARPSPAACEEVGALLAALESDDAVWDHGRMHQVLKAWALSLHGEAVWDPEREPRPGDGARPAVSWAPALVLRRRGQDASLRLYSEMIRQMEADPEAIPAGWQRLVSDGDDSVPAERGSSGEVRCSDGWPSGGEEIFFPLPANREQWEIVENLRGRRGVLVQGPPGTGKTHTIANLMCHLLASGQRVLVTAENPRALTVLRDKLPDPLKPLCISVIGTGGEAFSELNATVHHIATRSAGWNASENAAKVDSLRGELAGLRAEVDRVDGELRDIRLGETHNFNPVAGYNGKPESIAREVSAQREQFGWLDGRVESDEPFWSDREARTWLRLHRELTPEVRAEADLALPPAEQWPEPDKLAAGRQRRDAIDSELAGFAAEQSSPVFASLVATPAEQLAPLQEDIQRLDRFWREEAGAGWAMDAATELRHGGATSRWVAIEERSAQAVESIQALEDQLAGREVVIPSNRAPLDVQRDAQIVIEHLRGGGKWKGLLGKPKPIRDREYLIEEVTVDASPADEIDELEAVILAARQDVELDRVLNQWADIDPVPRGADRATRIHALMVRARHLSEIRELLDLDRKLRNKLQEITGQVLDADWVSKGAIRWHRMFQAISLAVERRRIDTEVKRKADAFDRVATDPAVHPATKAAAVALGRLDPTGYAEARKRAEQSWNLSASVQQLDALDRRFDEHEPNLRKAMLAAVGDPVLEERFAELARRGVGLAPTGGCSGSPSRVGWRRSSWSGVGQSLDGDRDRGPRRGAGLASFSRAPDPRTGKRAQGLARSRQEDG